DPARKGLDKLVCKDKEIKKLRRELKRVWDEVVDSRSKELESNKYEIADLRKELQRVWDEETNPLLREVDSKKLELFNLRKELQRVWEENSKLESAKDARAEAIQNELNFKSGALAEQEKSIVNLSSALEARTKELQGIYNSTVFRYFVHPAWRIIFPIKNFFCAGAKRLCRKISLLELRTQAQGLYHNVFLKLADKKVCLSHIKQGTYPLIPVRMTLMVTRLCNMRCKFCDIPDTCSPKQSMTKGEAQKAIAAAAELGIREVIFTGGEPLLHPDLFEIIKYAHLRRLKTAITTNGILLEERMETIAACPPHFMCVSIDGTKQIHDDLRNLQGAYDKIMRGIDLLLHNKVTTTVNFVVTNKNVFVLEQVYNEFDKRGIPLYFLPVINKPEFFPSTDNEQKVFLNFINKLKRLQRISAYDYEYLKMAIFSPSRYSQIWTRCFGLSSEFGVDTDGTISPCCVWANRKKELNGLGNVFTDNLSGLWHSEKFRNARVSIFKDGCRDCFNPSVADSRKFAGVSFIVRSRPQLNHNKGKNIPKPNHVHMRFTSRCNLHCRHCDIWKLKPVKSRELPVADWKKCIDKLHAWLGSYLVDLAGGEILLYPGAVELIRYCAERGGQVNLTTNGTLIDEAMAEKLGHSGITCINISIDGLANTHAYIRDRKEIFAQLEKSIRNLAQYKTIPHIAISTVINKYNLEELPELIRLPEKWGISSITFQALDNNFGAKYRPGWFARNEFWPTDKAKIEQTFDFLIKEVKSHMWIYISVDQLLAMKDYYLNPETATKGKCATGNNNFIIDEYGHVHLCWNMPAVGNLVKNDPERIWNSPQASRMRKNISGCMRTCRILNCNYSA
ncbi:MAG: radical SAM protein, partial [Candidatus Omnitrophota bacterium]